MKLTWIAAGVLSAGAAASAGAQGCETWLQRFGTSDLQGQIRDAVVFDDGDGPAIFAGGDFTSTAQGAAPIGAVAAWRNGRWEPLGEGGIDLDQPGHSVRALEVFDDGRGDALYIAGAFETVDGIAMNSIVRWDGSTWESLAGGLTDDNGEPNVCLALCAFDDGGGAQLYAWGRFSRAGGVAADGFARWNGVAWEALNDDLGNGSPNDYVVRDMAVFDDGGGPALYAGGNFGASRGHLTSGVARWGGSGWLALAQPLPSLGNNDDVMALEVGDFGQGESLFVGGAIEARLTDEITEGVLEWTGTEWLAVGTGLAGQDAGTTEVYALLYATGGDAPMLYAGGRFDARWLGADVQISRWDGVQWAAMDFGLQDRVYSIVEHAEGGGEPTVWALGGFQGNTRVPSPNLIEWEGENWAAAGRGFANLTVHSLAPFTDSIGPALFAGVSQQFHYIARLDEEGWIGYPGLRNPASELKSIDLGDGERLYAAFESGGDTDPALAVLDGLAWQDLGSTLFRGGIESVEAFDDGSGAQLYVGGGFGGAWGAYSQGATVRIGDAWLAMQGLDDEVLDWAVFDDGTGEAIYAAGAFQTVDGNPGRGVVRWTGSAWECVGGGLSATANALEVYDDGTGAALYAGGRFSVAGDNGASWGVARWTGTQWEALGDGLGANAQVFDLLVHDDGAGVRLYAAGAFATADGQPARGIAAWDGAAWSPVGTGVGINTGDIRALAAFDDGSGPKLAAGGTFSSIDGVLASRIAAWDGSAWASIGSGTDDHVYALAVFDDGAGEALFAGGAFRFADGQFSPRVARWNGSVWDRVGSIDDRSGRRVYALTVYDDGSGPKLYAGGDFQRADGVSVENAAAWDGEEWTKAPGANNQILSLKQLTYQGGEALGMGGHFYLAGGSDFRGIARMGDTGVWEGIPDAGLDGAVLDLLSVDDGTPSLYVGGTFLAPGEHVARFDGAAWHRLGDGFNLAVMDLELFDDGTGPAVYAAGEFTSSGTNSALRVAKWDGAAWVQVGGGIADGAVFSLSVHQSAQGPWLVAVGSFTTVAGMPSQGVAAWDGAQWIPFDPGLDGIGLTSTTVQEDGGPVLLVSGDFGVAGTTVAGSLAAWGPCPPEPCVADFNGDGSVNTLDVLAFLNAWNARDPAADINGDGNINTLDVLAFLNAWTAGC
ncbi:MAG TPA: GC-type dockerin domain-anchored protein [Phycisphaerales bacterium]|nr:GC-type dockerin domain-anchored protein [Phycisphaerales bacterium]